MRTNVADLPVHATRRGRRKTAAEYKIESPRPLACQRIVEALAKSVFDPT
jgi:hypothetical protein